MFIWLWMACLSNVVGDWKATKFYGMNTDEDLIRLIVREDLQGFLLVGSPGGFYSEVAVEAREDDEKGFELDISTDTLICSPIEKGSEARVFSCLNNNNHEYSFKEMSES